jgi:hypothetical protein
MFPVFKPNPDSISAGQSGRPTTAQGIGFYISGSKTVVSYLTM